MRRRLNEWIYSRAGHVMNTIEPGRIYWCLQVYADCVLFEAWLPGFHRIIELHWWQPRWLMRRRMLATIRSVSLAANWEGK